MSEPGLGMPIRREQAGAVGVELIVGNELDEQSDAVKAGVVLQQWQEQLCSPP